MNLRGITRIPIPHVVRKEKARERQKQQGRGRKEDYST